MVAKKTRKLAAVTGMLVLLMCQAGCAAKPVAGRWCEDQMTIDGSDGEWSDTPQYYDPDRQTILRVANNGEAVFLCLAISDRVLTRQIMRTGLTVWLDPRGEKAQTFGIHLPGRQGPNPGRAPHSENDVRHPARGRPAPPRAAAQLSPAEPLKALAITYQDATGPLKMKLDEVRRTGIDIAVGPPGPGHRLVYEFQIAFRSAPCLANLGPDDVVGLGIMAGSSMEKPPKSGAFGGMGGPGGDPGGGPGGGMGGGMGGGPGGGMGRPGGAPHGEKSEPVEVWLKIKLAQKQ